ncbi:plasmid mobilization protein [Gloeothece verrucosa]|uniref:plasmid mobilization protein n=1 Tax=Gloeothece verrucosa TaxID=2546359 RepID=UPI0003086BB3|nr:conjugal transfer protein [Gloeothece verrucosa]
MKLKQQRTDIVSVRFLPEEKEKLAQIAAQRNITVSGLVRLNALAQSDNSHIKFVPEVNRKLYFELGKVAEKLQENELNNDSLNSLYSLLNEVRKELIGIKPAPRSALNQ